METSKTSNFTCQSKYFISLLFTCQVLACELQPFSLDMIWQMTYIHKVQKLFPATLNRALIKSHGTIPFVAKPLRRKTIIKNGLDFED